MARLFFIFVFAYAVLVEVLTASHVNAALVLAEPFEDETTWRMDSVGGANRCDIQATTAVTDEAMHCNDTGTDEELIVHLLNPNGTTGDPAEFDKVVCCFDYRSDSPVLFYPIVDLLNDAGTAVAKIRNENLFVSGIQMTNNNGASTYSSGGPSMSGDNWYRVCFDFENDGAGGDYANDHLAVWVDQDPSTETADVESDISGNFADNISSLHFKGEGPTDSFFDNLLCGNASSDKSNVYNGIPRAFEANDDAEVYNDRNHELLNDDNSCAACDTAKTDDDYCNASDCLFDCVDNADTGGTACSEPGDETHTWTVDYGAERIYIDFADTPVDVASHTVIGAGVYGYLQVELGTASTQEWRMTGDMSGASCDTTLTEPTDFVATAASIGIPSTNTWREYFFFSTTDEDGAAWSIDSLDCFRAGIRKTNNNNRIQVEAFYAVYVTKAVADANQPILMSRLAEPENLVECAR